MLEFLRDRFWHLPSMGDLESVTDVLGVVENSVDAGHRVATGTDEETSGRMEPRKGAGGDPCARDGKLAQAEQGVFAEGQDGLFDAEALVLFAAGCSKEPVYGCVTECWVERCQQGVQGHHQAIVPVLRMSFRDADESGVNVWHGRGEFR